jgi:hypothetical protein
MGKNIPVPNVSDTFVIALIFHERIFYLAWERFAIVAGGVFWYANGEKW